MQAGDLERSLTYAQRAARNAERLFAHDEALQFLAQARESAEALQRADALPAIDEETGDIHAARGTTVPAVASYERALAGNPSSPRIAAIKAKVGAVYCAVGDPRGVPYLTQALAELDPAAQTSELARATALMGRYHHYRTEHRKAIEWLERARVLAEPLGDPHTVSTIQTFRAGAHQHLLEYDESDRWARASIALGERARFPLAIASGYEFLGENAAARGHWQEALAAGRRDYEEGTKAGALARVAWARFCLAQGFHGQGALAEGRKETEEALALCEEIGEIRLAAWLAPLAAMIYADQGDHEAARTIAERNLERVGDLEQMLLTAWALHGVGYAAMFRDDPAAALDAYQRYLPLVRDTENGVAKLLILPHCADAFARGGRLDEAGRIAAQGDRACRIRQGAASMGVGARRAGRHSRAPRRKGRGGPRLRRGDCALHRARQPVRACPHQGPQGRAIEGGTMTQTLKPASIAAQALGWVDETTRAIAPPIHPSTTFLRDPDNQYRSGRIYARDDNATFDQAEAVLTALEGGHASLLFASGMAAATAVFQALAPGDHVLAPKVMYWSLRNWLRGFATQWGLRVDVDRHGEPRRRAARSAAGQDQARVDRDAGQSAVDDHRHRRDLRHRACGGRRRGGRFDRGDAGADAAAGARRRPRHALGDQVPQRPLRRGRRRADDARGHASSGSASGPIARSSAASSGRSRRGS